MDYKFKLISTEYVEGNFKRNEDIFNSKDTISSIGGNIEIGSLNERSTNDIMKLALKLKLVVVTKERKTDLEIAKMETKNILLFEFENKEIMSDIKEKPQNYNELIKNMVNTGYLSIKEYIENSFSRAKLSVQLPFTLMK